VVTTGIVIFGSISMGSCENETNPNKTIVRAKRKVDIG